MEYQAEILADSLAKHLQAIAKKYQITLEATSAKGRFQELIVRLSEFGKVVVLIDEYDRPITNYITDTSKANQQRETLRTFYEVLKPLGKHIRLVFITGITKYSKVSLFSVVNNLIDLTFDHKAASIVGITQTELEHYFDEYLTQAITINQKTKEDILKLLKQKYNGYSWNGETFVYNPFSLLNFFRSNHFKHFWFSSGTPAFLTKILQRHKVSGEQMERKLVDEFFFENFEVRRNLDVFSLLFQTGYLTIKSIKRRTTFNSYVLSYPNDEVRHAFIHHLLEAYSYKNATTISSAAHYMEVALEERDIRLFREQLNVLLSDISYRLFPFEKKDKDELREQQEFMAWEGYFHTIIYLVLQYVGVNMQVEISKHQGQIDAVVETEHYLYVMEYNPDSYREEDAELALKQIIGNKYAHPYVNSPKEVVLMGIAFDRTKREVKNIKWLVWDKEINQ